MKKARNKMCVYCVLTHPEGIDGDLRNYRDPTAEWHKTEEDLNI